MVGVNGARDKPFTELRDRVDDRLSPAAGDRIGGEQHAGGRGIHHLLHHDRQAHAVRADAIGLPVDHRALVPEGCPAPPYRIQQVDLAEHVQVGVLLAGKRGARQVLGVGR